MGKKLAFKDPPSLKFHNRTDISVEANDLGLKMPKLVALFGGKMNEHALLLTPNEKAGLIPSLRQ